MTVHASRLRPLRRPADYLSAPPGGFTGVSIVCYSVVGAHTLTRTNVGSPGQFRVYGLYWGIVAGSNRTQLAQYSAMPVAPVAYEVILEPGIIGQFRGFESPYSLI